MLSDYKCIQSKITDTSKTLQYFLCNYHKIQRFVSDHTSQACIAYDESDSEDVYEDDVSSFIDHIVQDEDDDEPLPILRLSEKPFFSKSRKSKNLKNQKLRNLENMENKFEKKQAYKKLIPMMNKKLPLTMLENNNFMLNFSGFLRPNLSLVMEKKECSNATFKEKLQFICNSLQFTNFNDCNITCIDLSYNSMQETEMFMIVDALKDNVYGEFGNVEEIDLCGNFHVFDVSEERSMWMAFFLLVSEKFPVLKTLNFSNTGKNCAKDTFLFL